MERGVGERGERGRGGEEKHRVVGDLSGKSWLRMVGYDTTRQNMAAHDKLGEERIG